MVGWMDGNNKFHIQICLLSITSKTLHSISLFLGWYYDFEIIFHVHQLCFFVFKQAPTNQTWKIIIHAIKAYICFLIPIVHIIHWKNYA